MPPGPLQLDAHADLGETGPDDDDVRLAHRMNVTPPHGRTAPAGLTPTAIEPVVGVHFYSERMRYGFVVPYADSREFSELAALGEQRGWDGVFTWEALFGVDAWVSLAAAAMVTE